MIFLTKYMIFRKYSAITLWPVIIMNKRFKNSVILINHEKIHLKQQIEMLVIPFYLWYFFEFIIRYFQYKSWQLAYRNISFEREAYSNQNNMNYIVNRKFWGFWEHIRI